MNGFNVSAQKYNPVMTCRVSFETDLFRFLMDDTGDGAGSLLSE